MAESGSDWPYTLAGALLLLTVVAHCAIKISTWIGDNAYSRQQKRLSRLSSLREAKRVILMCFLKLKSTQRKQK